MPTCSVGELDLDGRLKWDSVEATHDGIYQLVGTTTDTHCLGFGDPRSVDPAHRVGLPTVLRCDRPQGQDGATATGPVCGKAFVCRSCICNAHNAMCNRHAKRRAEPTRQFEHMYDWFSKFRSELSDNYIYSLAQWEYNDLWINKWTQNKRASILKSLMEDDYCPGRVKLMVKREALGGFKNKARGIQMYSTLCTQARFGARITALQKAFAKVFSRESERHRGMRFVFASGLNSKDFGAWMTSNLEEGRTWFYERDGKAWDATMQLIHQLIKEHVVGLVDPAVADFLRACYRVRGSYRGQGNPAPGFNYEVEGTTKSGHNDTSLGNSIINAAVAMEALFTLDLPGLQCDVMVMGDDLLVASNQPIPADLMSEAERALGIDPDARSFQSWEDVSFISGIWAPYEGGFTFTAKPGSILSKLFWAVNPPSHRHAQAYRNGIVKGLLPSFEGWPVLDTFLRSQLVDGHSFITREHAYWAAETEESRFDHRTLAWFKERYNLTSQDLVEVERFLSGLPVGPSFVKHHVLTAIMDRDNEELQDRAQQHGSG